MPEKKVATTQSDKRKSGDILPKDSVSSCAALFPSETGKNYIKNKTKHLKPLRMVPRASNK